MRVAIPFQIPSLIKNVVLAKDEDNCFTKKKNATGSCGRTNVSSCLPVALADVKKVSEAEKATINDVVLCALTTAFNTLFKERKDPNKTV